MRKCALLVLAAAEAPNPKTDAVAAKGPAAIAEALEGELAKAKKAGDKEHEASIEKHWADYLAERKERIDDAKGGVIHTRQREAIAEGPAAVVAALESELKEAEKFGDEEHIASIKKHLANYLSERKERISDEKGGVIPTRQRRAIANGPAAVVAALKDTPNAELQEAEKFHDKEHIASIEKHLANYESERAERITDETGAANTDKNRYERLNGRQGAAFKEDLEHHNTAATDAALLQELREALKFHDAEHVRSILKHADDYHGHQFGGRYNPWDYASDEEGRTLEHIAYEHRITEVNDPGGNDGHITKEQAYSEARKEHNYAPYARAECHLPLPTSNDLKHAAGCRSGFSYGQWSTVYNALSFGIASMGSAMLFVWLMIYNTHKKFRPALGINGLVTGIATYHYFRIFNSWNEAFDVFFDGALGRFVVNSSGQPFNDAYRYVDWLLTVPLLLIELIMVMQLPEGEAGRKMWMLGVFSGLMVANGYPGEIQDDPAGRWFYWTLSMIPFTYVLYELYFGLAEATKKHAPSVAALIASARYLTAISWLTYPFVYMVKGVGLGGSDATMAEQVGYSIADVTAKAVFGIVIWRIANEKTIILEEQEMLK